jgi:hypothetical protein
MLTIIILRLMHSVVERKFESSKTKPMRTAIMPLIRIDISKTASRWFAMRPLPTLPKAMHVAMNIDGPNLLALHPHYV